MKLSEEIMENRNIRNYWILRNLFLIIGVILGFNQICIGIKAAFVSTGNESLLFWLFILSCPLTTLPAVVVGYFRHQFGAIWLICGSIISMMSLLISGVHLNRAIVYSGPMFILGVSLLFLIYYYLRTCKIA